MTRIQVAERPTRPGAAEMRRVGNDDQVQFLAEFSGGATGHLEASRMATGSKMDITFELTGTEGAIHFDGERLGELRLYARGDGGDRQGFRTIHLGPAHPPYGNFLPGAGHGISFNDLKVIEVQALMQLVAAGKPAEPDLAGAAHIGRVLDAVLASAAGRRWVEPGA
jgi:predicted dehydrogenase